MRQSFEKWLLIFVASAFGMTLLISFVFSTRQSIWDARELIDLRIQDAKKQLGINELNLKSIREMVAEDSKAKARAFANMIQLSPAIVGEEKTLQRIAKELKVDELHVSDDKGILIGSYPARPEYRRYDMNSDEQSRPFMRAIKDPDFEFVQEVQKQGAGAALLQYTGVARRDEPGIVQVAYLPERLREAIRVADIANLASGFRVGTNGKIIVVQNDTIISIDERERIGKKVWEIGFLSDNFKSLMGDFWATIDHVPVFCYYEKWNDMTILGILPKEEVFADRNSLVVGLIVVYLILFGVVFVLVSHLVQWNVIRKIEEINRSLKRITDGDLNEKVAVVTNQEFTDLSNGINTTVEALKRANEERVARLALELEFARAIQLSVLPNVFPPFPERNEFDIYATIQTAKEVGGDFYDFFLVDDNHLAFVIADVADKGVPAALFMMTTKTLINNYTKTGMSPAEVFSKTNDYLCENNEESMFVTALIGILEIDTGHVTLVNGGHNPPLLGTSNVNYQWLQVRGGRILGALPDCDYERTLLTLNPGDSIFLYTDGVTEAFHSENMIFGNDRLLSLLNRPEMLNLPIEDLLNQVGTELAQWRGTTKQSDDITMLAIRYHGKGE